MQLRLKKRKKKGVGNRLFKYYYSVVNNSSLRASRKMIKKIKGYN